MVLEKVSGENMEHLGGLVRLQNPHLASVRNVFYGNSNYMVVETVSERNSSAIQCFLKHSQRETYFK